jgi:hypothetical protein
MNAEFKQWLEEQEYDWDIRYNSRVQTEGRIWMLKNVYNHYRLMEQASHILTTDNMDIIKYKWGEIIDEYNRRINYEHRI